MAIDLQKIIDHNAKLQSLKDTYSPVWDDIGKYAIPRKDAVYTKFDRVKGERTSYKLYDASGVHFAELLASALHSMLTNPTLEWFEMIDPDDNINKKPHVRKWFQRLVTLIHQIDSTSNFHTENQEVYIDLVTFATAPMMILEDDDLVWRHKAQPVYEVALGENSKGDVDTVFSESSMTMRQIVQMFGEEPLKKSTKYPGFMKEMEKEYVVLHAVFPRGERELQKRNAKNLPIASVYLIPSEKLLLKESGFNEMPYVTPRWGKVSGEVYGRGPSHKAIADIMMLQAVMRDYIRASQKRTDPPTFIEDDSVIGPVRFTPGSVITLRPGSETPKSMEFRSDLRVAFDMAIELRNRLKEHYYITQLQLREGPQMTATEVDQRSEESLRILSPLLGRLRFEYLQPMMARKLAILERKGLLPDNMPEELEGRIPEVVFVSQIARAQKLSEAMNLNRALESMGPALELDQTSADIIDTDKMIRHIASIYGVSEEIFRDPKEVEGIRELRSQEQQEQQELANAEQAANAANKAGGLLQE